MRINGKHVEGMASPGSYLNISRVWKKGDRIEMQLPMRLTAEPLPDDPKLQAFLYGPIVLAGELGTQGLTEELVRHQQGQDTKKAPLDVPDLVASGGKAVDAARQSGLRQRVIKIIDESTRYAEGTGVRLNVTGPKDIPVIMKLAAIKIEN